jgi:hypothetical protein
MWILLFTRLRTWLLIAVALPLARTLVHRAAASTERRRPRTALATWLNRADATLTSASQRPTRRRRRTY